MTENLSNSRKQEMPRLALKNGPLICLALFILLTIAMLTLTRPVFSEENKTLNPLSTSDKAANLAPWPRLLVDNDVVDFGDAPFGKMLEYTFNLKNAGAQPLNILGIPEVKTLEGCWPFRPVVGSTTINPGESSYIKLRFSMHDGMGGPHHFVMIVKSNDPMQPAKEFHVKANFPPNSVKADSPNWAVLSVKLVG